MIGSCDPEQRDGGINAGESRANYDRDRDRLFPGSQVMNASPAPLANRGRAGQAPDPQRAVFALLQHHPSIRRIIGGVMKDQIVGCKKV